MDDETDIDILDAGGREEPEAAVHSDYQPADRFDASAVHHLSGMYQNWFLDYASYVILERAVPHIEDGLKPVQRRILHSMKRMDDGRYNKVANIVGHTMQFHPHGDASIGDALVQLGQKDLLVDTQGNWGNILTGDRAAAPRYIEARLSKFALDTVFNPKTTDWQLSYDGRNREPVTLPVKFPLLLAQGAEGIAVGLSSKILPHNFCELCDAAVACLHGQEFRLLPDFPTGGSIDAAKYNDGRRGGTLKVRAKIEKLDSRTLAIREIPYGKTTATLIDSIIRAVEKGKIKARKVEDNTAAEVEILVHLMPGVSSDKTLDALYAFSDCEVSISPNCCVIADRKPQFLSVSDVLRANVDSTRELLRRELEIRKAELMEQLHFASLEKIFIEERIYKDKKFEQAPDTEAVCRHIDDRLTPYYPQLVREVTRDDILRLLEIKMQRILKFNADKADELMARIKAEIEAIDKDLGQMTEVAARWFTFLKDKYGAGHPRRTEVRSFDTIQAAKVVEATEKLYIDRQNGFVGTGLKKAEQVCNCSDLDEIIIFYGDGKFRVTRVAEKIDIGKRAVRHIDVFKRGDKRTIYNMVYRDGKKGYYYMKRFFVSAVIRDREYDLTRGNEGSLVMYFTANKNGEAEIVRAIKDTRTLFGMEKTYIDRNFADVPIRSRDSQGQLLIKKPLSAVRLHERGGSTLAGRPVWWEADVRRLNYDERGQLLGSFSDGDMVLVLLAGGQYYTCPPDANAHFEDTVLRVEKFDADKVWTAVVVDADNKNYAYIKRFRLEPTRKAQPLAGENEKSQLLVLSDKPFPRVRIEWGGADAVREAATIEAESFVMVKGYKAHGKRVANWTVAGAEELEPIREADELPDQSGQSDESDKPDESDQSDTNTAQPSDMPDMSDMSDTSDNPEKP